LLRKRKQVRRVDVEMRVPASGRGDEARLARIGVGRERDAQLRVHEVSWLADIPSRPLGRPTFHARLRPCKLFRPCRKGGIVPRRFRRWVLPRLGIPAIAPAAVTACNGAYAADPQTVAKIANDTAGDRQGMLEAGARKEGEFQLYTVGSQIDPLLKAFGD